MTELFAQRRRLVGKFRGFAEQGKTRSDFENDAVRGRQTDLRTEAIEEFGQKLQPGSLPGLVTMKMNEV